MARWLGFSKRKPILFARAIAQNRKCNGQTPSFLVDGLLNLFEMASWWFNFSMLSSRRLRNIHLPPLKKVLALLTSVCPQSWRWTEFRYSYCYSECIQTWSTPSPTLVRLTACDDNDYHDPLSQSLFNSWYFLCIWLLVSHL